VTPGNTLRLKVALGIVLCVSVVLAAGCGGSTSNSSTDISQTSGPTPQQVERESCVTTLAAMLDDGIAAIVESPNASDQVLSRFSMQYGTNSETFQSFLRIYLSLSGTISRFGIARASADALKLTNEECARLHPEPTTTTTLSATTSTARYGATTGRRLGVPQAPALLSDKCTTGEIRGGLALVECVVGAWRSGQVDSEPHRLSADARAALLDTPAPETIKGVDCSELESSTEGGFAVGNTSIIDVECKYRIDGDRIARFKLINQGGSDGQSVASFTVTTD
jgi:hypothetical protein